MFIETERTPNPATLKFLPGQAVMSSGTAEFRSPEEAERSPLARMLFSLGDVTGVFLGADFISVTKAEGSADWREMKAPILGLIMDHFASGAPAIEVEAEDAPAGDDDPADADIVAQIKDLLETRIRPAVARDGGDVLYHGFKEGTVYLRMQGACSGCPSSTATLKQGIAGLLKHYVPEVTNVEAIPA
jgi:Fe-S cluster biogenesis protein NfuA